MLATTVISKAALTCSLRSLPFWFWAAPVRSSPWGGAGGRAIQARVAGAKAEGPHEANPFLCVCGGLV